MTQPLAYSYIRFSSPKQAEGDSLRRQTEATERWCDENNYQLVTSYQDLGISARRGKNADKGRLGDFLTSVKAGLIPKGSVLIVERLDRLSRDVVKSALQLLLNIIDNGVKIVTIHDGRMYDDDVDATSLIIAIIELSAAHAMNEAKVKRVIAAHINRNKRIADGEILSGNCPGWCEYDKDKRKFIVDPEKAKVIKRIFAELKNGKTLDKIAEELNKDGIAALSGYREKKKFTRQAVRWILRNKGVLGKKTVNKYTKHGDEEKKEISYYPQIIDTDLYNECQIILTNRSKPRRNKDNIEVNLLAGLLVCSSCGGKLQRANAKANGSAYTRCCEPGCSVKSAIDHRSLELAVLALLRDHIKEGDFQGDTSAKERKGLNKKLEESESKKEELNEKIDYIIEVGSKQKSSSERVAKRIDKLEKELDAVEENIKEIKTDLEKLDREQSSTVNNVKSIRSIVANLKNDNEARTRTANSLRRIVDNIVVDTRQQVVMVHLRGSGIVFTLTPLSLRFLYVEESEPIEALQIKINQENDEIEEIETELIGNNIIVDRCPADQTVHNRPRIEHIEDKIIIHPHILATPQHAILTVSEAAKVSGLSITAIKKRCKAGKIYGAYYGVDRRWQIPRGSVQIKKK